MSLIKPFQAVTFNQEKLTDISSLACPPYDVISSERQRYYHQLNPYNFIHQYTIKGEKRIRLGFIALLELDKGSGSVLGHEHTRLEAKEDRLKTIRQTNANLSPIFVVFADKKRIVQRLYREFAFDKKPFIEITDDEKNIHKLWRIDNPFMLEDIQSKMSQEKIFIADGHHRYEVACAYRNQLQQKFPHLKDPSFNYIMAYFTNTDSRGLSILA
ncbi:MAG: DUF1015 domain-containing protein, partial [Candidatus Omnitrophica bacterium]|nr:DUF1015 domain-containing protein [Candidatus Omnitrophota bacterium]